MATKPTTERVTVFTRDGRPAYAGTAALPQTEGRYAVTNDETGETVNVPAAFVAPEGAHDDCDCDSCLALWEASNL